MQIAPLKMFDSDSLVLKRKNIPRKKFFFRSKTEGKNAYSLDRLVPFNGQAKPPFSIVVSVFNALLLNVVFCSNITLYFQKVLFH